MNKCHVPITWVNDQAPAINDTHLNQYDGELDTLDDRVITLDTTKAAQSDMLLAFKDVSLNSTTGVITFTLFNNTTKTIDTLLEKVAINFDYDDDPTSPHYQNLIIELEDGTYKYIDMSALITEYEFVNSSTVAFTVAADGSVSASVIDGSITATKLDPTFAVAINDAEANGLKSEGWAVGEQNGTPVTSGSPYYHNNAKWYKDQAQAIAGQTLGGLTDVTITTPSDGDALVYDANSGEWVNGNAGDNSITAKIEGAYALSAHSVGDYVSYNGTIYEVTASISAGDALVVGTNIQAATLAEGTVIYIAPFVGKTFNNCTDAEIASYVALADAGVIDLYSDCGWRVGQEHQVSLSAIAASGTYDGVSWTVGEAQSAQTVTFVLSHRGGYELVSSVLDTHGNPRYKCSFQVDLKDCMETKGSMNNSATYSGTWDSSARRGWCNGGFREAIPSVLRGAFKQFKTITAQTYNGSTNKISDDYFALRAEKEVFGVATYSNSTEAAALSQVDNYILTANRIKLCDGTAENWLLRSPDKSNSSYCTIVLAAGDGPYYSAAYPTARGISPFGCI